MAETRRQNPVRDDLTYVYIAGRGRSGTTLLNLLLGNHDQVSAIGELSNLSLQCFRDDNTKWPGQCGCGLRPFDCELWGKVIDDIESKFSLDMRNKPFNWRMSDVGIEEEYRDTAYRRVPLFWARNKLWRALRVAQYCGPELLARVAGLYTPQRRWIENRSFVLKKISDLTSSRVVVDISKDYLGSRDVYDFAILPTKILFITRDCRGNVWSKVRQAGQGQDRNKVVAACSLDWTSVNQKILTAIKKIPEADRMHIRYEDLCRNPADTLKSALNFIGLPYQDNILRFQEKVEHTIAGNSMRFSGRTTKIQEDLAWQDNLSSTELAQIRDICGDLAAELGYQM